MSAISNEERDFNNAVIATSLINTIELRTVQQWLKVLKPDKYEECLEYIESVRLIFNKRLTQLKRPVATALQENMDKSLSLFYEAYNSSVIANAHPNE